MKSHLKVVSRKGKLVSVRRSRHTIGARMNGKKLVSCDLLAFPLERTNYCGPCRPRNPSTVFPLLDSPMTLTNVARHLGDGRPALKDVVEGLHGPSMTSDELSGQGRAIIPMTTSSTKPTMRAMGRGITPVRFRVEMAERLKAARLVAGFSTQLDAANALAVGLDRYRKWESGRTPVPAQYVPLVCDIFNIDANYLYGVQKAARKTA